MYRKKNPQLFGKNHVRRFAGTDIFERIFKRILEEAEKSGYVDF